MKTEKSLLLRLFIFNIISLVVCAIWFLSLANTTNLLIQKGNYEVSQNPYNLHLNGSSITTSQTSYFQNLIIYVPWYDYVLFALAIIVLMRWSVYCLELYFLWKVKK